MERWRYTIENCHNSKYCTGCYTLYDYCIILQKYKYIIQYCESIITSTCMYTVDKYFEYCREGNIGAIYYCIKVLGVDAE